ncbi:MAG: ABC transporter ATP-binding protein [Anaerolineales bacterium]|nr:ABC transporter ATP-binding protein [Anaerolineales bacterium]
MTALELRDLACAYDRRTVVERISLEARPGQVLALIGPNGAGKSTLLRAMARLLKPARGKVILAGRELWGLSARETARRLAFAAQKDGDPWPATVMQIVSLGRAPHRGWLLPLTGRDRQASEEALALVGLEGMADRLATELSGGEHQRMVLARVLAQEPSFLLLDEPTSHLDLKYQTGILGLVHRLAHHNGLAVVVSLHDLNLAAVYADRVALLSGGTLDALGTPAEVLTPDRLTRAYGVPILVTRHPTRDSLFVTPDFDSMEGADDAE